MAPFSQGCPHSSLAVQGAPLWEARHSILSPQVHRFSTTPANHELSWVMSTAPPTTLTNSLSLCLCLALDLNESIEAPSFSGDLCWS